MSVKQLISGGQTGVDRAALDVALELGIACGGWCPRGRMAEDGAIPERYPLRETPTAEYAERTRRNVEDADGTLILTVGEPVGGTTLTREHAATLGKPCLVIDLAAANEAVSAAAGWLRDHEIRVLNVAGPRESESPGVGVRAGGFLRKLLAAARL